MLTNEFWGRYFTVYDSLTELTPYGELLDLICDRARAGHASTVLDVGSGTGNLALKLRARGARVIGIDWSIDGLHHHRRKDAGATLIAGDLTRPLPLRDDSIDVIVSNNALDAIWRGARSHTLQELLRVLKPGGRIVIASVVAGFSRTTIYADHLRAYARAHGILRTVRAAICALRPTLRIWYFNAQIQKSRRRGGCDLFAAGEQRANLVSAGFVNVTDDEAACSGQAILNTAEK